MRSLFVDMFIAYRELLAVLLACQVFAKLSPNCFIRLNSDSTSVVAWVNKGRCSKRPGFLILSAIETFKFNFGLKMKAVYIKSRHNHSADKLSRNLTPPWLASRGVRLKVNIPEIVKLLDNPLPFWQPQTKTPF